MSALTTTILWFLATSLSALLATFLSVMTSDRAASRVGKLLGLEEPHTAPRDLFIKNRILKFLGLGMGGILIFLQVLIAQSTAQEQARATAEQARSNENVETGQRQERLRSAIDHLGNPSPSVRLGAAYELFHLASDTEELRQTVLDILCGHLRETTRTEPYRRANPARPSEEVQSILALLFLQDHQLFEDHDISLQESWLRGANLESARLNDADLRGADLSWAQLMRAELQGAEMYRAELQYADLSAARLQRADLREAELAGASLDDSHLTQARLVQARLQGASLKEARLADADLTGAELWGASLTRAWLPGADLTGAQFWGASLAGATLWAVVLDRTELQAADLSGARIQGAALRDVQLQEARLRYARLHGARPYENIVEDLGFAHRIERLVGATSDLTDMVFGCGMRNGESERIIESLSEVDSWAEPSRRDWLAPRLQRHSCWPAINELASDSFVIVGQLDADDAESMINEFYSSDDLLYRPPPLDRNMDQLWPTSPE